MATRIIVGDALDVLRTLPAGSHQCCVTSPPYYGLRDYGHAGQIGLEATPNDYIARMVGVFREVRRVLRDDGTLWLNIGDSYSATQTNNGGCSPKSTLGGGGGRYRDGSKNATAYAVAETRRRFDGAKPKDLLGIPWQLAFALRADGWFLRSAIVWSKPNPMPESIRDRPTSAYEMVFLLSKRPRYFYDAEAIKEEALTEEWPGIGPQHGQERGRGEAYKPMKVPTGWDTEKGRHHGTIHQSGRRKDLRSATEERHRSRVVGGQSLQAQPTAKRNARNVWTIATQPFAGAHFATMPPRLVERCVLAGSRPGDAVLDPFGGAGTTGLVALELQRSATLIELNPDYADMARRRIGLFAEMA